MHLENIKRWQWMLVGLVIGLAIGLVQRGVAIEGVNSWNNSINGQADFEVALMKNTEWKDGSITPNMWDIRVTRMKLPDAEYYVITGGYWDGLFRPDKGGGRKPHPQPSMIMFRVDEPYKPVRKLATPAAKSLPGQEWMAKFTRICEKLRLKDVDRPDSVIAYLDQVRLLNDKMNYSYPWWKTGRTGVVMWAAGCFVLIGVIWPTIVNLLVFHSLFRPREDAIDLSGVKDRDLKQTKKVGMTAADMDQLKKLEAELEAKLQPTGAGAAARAAALVVEEEKKPAVRQLTGTVVETSTAMQKEEEQAEFEAKQDDFYPIARPHHKPHDDAHGAHSSSHKDAHKETHKDAHK